jgi:hypothetical protein
VLDELNVHIYIIIHTGMNKFKFGRMPSLGDPEVPTIGVHVATLEL